MENNNKQIIMTGNSLLIDIQKHFNIVYPFLKIEFCTNSKGIFPSKKHLVNPQSPLSMVSGLSNEVTLHLDDDRTVAEIETDCRELLEVSSQVYRKSGNVWNVISLTDNWTLRSQNNAAEFISTEMAPALG
jgi:hypothetical protein